MQIVIEIPDNLYNDCMTSGYHLKGGKYSMDMAYAVRNGNVIPQEHGRLVNENEFLERIKPYDTDDAFESAFFNLAKNIIASTSTVIPATKKKEKPPKSSYDVCYYDGKTNVENDCSCCPHSFECSGSGEDDED